MNETKYVYHRGTKDGPECIEFDILKRGRYITTCVVIVDFLAHGATIFPCSNGTSYKLSDKQRLELLEAVQAERKKITDSFPVKTYAGWLASGFRTFEDYCFPGDEVDDAMVSHLVNSEVPILNRSSCTQIGGGHNAVRDRTGKIRTTYITFHRLGPNRWQFDGYCFYKENTNREDGPTRLERRIEEVRKEIEATLLKEAQK